VQGIRGCLERVTQHGLRLTIEHHTHTLIPETAAFLRLWEALKDPDLG